MNKDLTFCCCNHRNLNLIIPYLICFLTEDVGFVLEVVNYKYISAWTSSGGPQSLPTHASLFYSWPERTRLFNAQCSMVFFSCCHVFHSRYEGVVCQSGTMILI